MTDTLLLVSWLVPVSAAGVVAYRCRVLLGALVFVAAPAIAYFGAVGVIAFAHGADPDWFNSSCFDGVPYCEDESMQIGAFLLAVYYAIGLYSGLIAGWVTRQLGRLRRFS